MEERNTSFLYDMCKFLAHVSHTGSPVRLSRHVIVGLKCHASDTTLGSCDHTRRRGKEGSFPTVPGLHLKFSVIR